MDVNQTARPIRQTSLHGKEDKNIHTKSGCKTLHNDINLLAPTVELDQMRRQPIDRSWKQLNELKRSEVDCIRLDWIGLDWSQAGGHHMGRPSACRHVLL